MFLKRVEVGFLGGIDKSELPDVRPREARVESSPADTCLFPAAGLDFEAILLQPSNPPDKTQVPMVVMPHGRRLAS